MAVREVRLYIAGDERDGASTVELIEPSKGAVSLRVHLPSPEQVDHAVNLAAQAFEGYSRIGLHARSDVLGKVAGLVADSKSDFVEAMVAATGKTRRDASGEVDRSVETLKIASEETLRIEGFEVPMEASPRGKGRIAIVRRFPIGVVAAITPFNAPLNTVCHKIAPALAAGNTVVLKPDQRGAEVAVLLARLFTKAGLPPAALNVIHGDAREGSQLVRHRLVEVVGFTGSEQTGASILAVAGIKRFCFELGGNAPAIVHSDADVAAAARDLVPASFGMSGQSCISTQRIYVHQSRYAEFLERMIAAAKGLKIGDPTLPDTDIGPLVTEEAAKRVESWIKEAVAGGARVECGGHRRGSIVEPTILTGVQHDMAVVCKEVFGPVVSVLPYELLDDALRWANSTPYGLQAGIYTGSLEAAMRAGRELRFGGVVLNGPSRWRLDHMPYGGVKRSGIGREGPRFAIEDMMELRMLVLG